MTTVYPNAEDSFDRPTASSSLSGHAALHDDLADAIEAIENKVGVDNSTDTTSIDYKLAHLGDTYYTETEVDNALAGKLNSSDYTAANVLSKIKTVDGAGSGLDADLLDGNQASAFAPAHSHPYAPSDHDHDDRYYTEAEVNASFAGAGHTTHSGRQTFTNCGLSGQSYANASLVLDASAGSQASIAFYHYWNGSSYAPQIRSAANYLYFRDGQDGDNAILSVNKIESRNPSLNSSRTIKHDIEAFTGDATSIVDGLETVTFRYNDGDTDQQHLGFIAEDVATVFPMAVDQSGDTPTLNIAHIIALSIAGLQEANERIAQLEAKVAELEAG